MWTTCFDHGVDHTEEDGCPVCNIKAESADQIAALEARVKALSEALEFYADRGFDGYDVGVTDYGLSIEAGEIIKDGGERARAALQENTDATNQ